MSAGIFLDRMQALITLLLAPLVSLSAWGRKRLAFEAQRSAPMRDPQWAFHVSSEGELEQVRPWISELLARGERLQLLFTSESVLKAQQELLRLHPQQVELIPLPLLSYRPGLMPRLVRAPRLVMVRYDFFPHLLRLARERQAVLVWASLIGKEDKLRFFQWRAFYHWLFSAFKLIVPATVADEKLLRSMGLAGVAAACEMRVARIDARLAQAQATFSSKFPHWEKFQAWWQQVPRERRLVLGSVWESDLALFSDPVFRAQLASGQWRVAVVPHKLSAQWSEKLASIGVTSFDVHSNWPGSASGSCAVINLKGVLCELYGEAHWAYVGGGFERSVHSVLEPFVAGASVRCGRAVHRSSEVRLIQAVAPHRLAVLADAQELFGSLISSPPPQNLTGLPEWRDNQKMLLVSHLQRARALC